jgi:hypothetical protein
MGESFLLLFFKKEDLACGLAEPFKASFLAGIGIGAPVLQEGASRAAPVVRVCRPT